MKKRLNKKELEILAEICHVDLQALTNVSHILDMGKARDELIKNEFKQHTAKGKYSRNQIIMALTDKYHIGRSTVELAIYGSPAMKTCKCDRCGADMTQYKYNRYDGLCDRCIAKDMNGDCIQGSL